MNRRVFISTTSFATVGKDPLEALERAGFEVAINSLGRKLQPAESMHFLQGVHGLIAGTERLDREVLTSAPSLRVISRCGTGTDNIDLEAADELGIEILRTPSAHVDAVAELTLAGTLALLRHVHRADREIRKSEWHKRMGNLLRGKKVGLIGLGQVGKRMAELLAPFDVELLATDPEPDDAFAESMGIAYVELADLLQAAEIVMLLLAAPASDKPLLDRARIESMRRGAYLVNTSRGGQVEESSLVAALESGQLAGAYLDVFASEPYEGPLAALDNVVLTPHIGSYAAEARLQMEQEAVENLIGFFARKEGS